jgi:hypothetical protein
MSSAVSSKFVGVMIFYIILSYIICPAIAYKFFGKTTKSLGNGFVVGSILSIILWFTVGSKMVQAQTK